MSRTMKRYTIGVAALVAAWVCGQTVAQAGTTRTTVVMEDRLATPSSNAQTGLPSGINLSAGTEGGVVSVSGRHSWEDSGDALGIRTFTLKVSAPVGKQDAAGAFPTDGNLLNGSSLEFSYSRTIMPGRFPAPDFAKEKAYYLKAQQECLRRTAVALADKACGLASERGDDPAFSIRSLEQFLSATDLAAISDAAFNKAPLWRWGVSGSVGYHNFDFRDPTTLNQQSESRADLAASLFLNWVGWTVFGSNGGASAQVTLAGGAEYKNTYADAKSKTLCRAAPASGPQECFTGAFGVPQQTETGDAFVDLKWDPPKDTSTRIGLKGAEVKTTYDFEGTGATVGGAIYLIGDDKGKPTGGLKFSWLSDHQTPVKGRNFMVGVFAGVPFP